MVSPILAWLTSGVIDTIPSSANGVSVVVVGAATAADEPQSAATDTAATTAAP